MKNITRTLGVPFLTGLAGAAGAAAGQLLVSMVVRSLTKEIAPAAAPVPAPPAQSSLQALAAKMDGELVAMRGDVDLRMNELLTEVESSLDVLTDYVAQKRTQMTEYNSLASEGFDVGVGLARDRFSTIALPAPMAEAA